MSRHHADASRRSWDLSSHPPTHALRGQTGAAVGNRRGRAAAARSALATGRRAQVRRQRSCNTPRRGRWCADASPHGPRAGARVGARAGAARSSRRRRGHRRPPTSRAARRHAVPAPPPPLVGGAARRDDLLLVAALPALRHARRRRRSRRTLWPLADSGSVARDTRGSADGVYSRAGHALTADGPLSGEVDFSSRFDGAADAVARSGRPRPCSPGTRAHTVELWVRPQTVDDALPLPRSRASSRTPPGGRARASGSSRAASASSATATAWASSVTIASGLPQGDVEPRRRELRRRRRCGCSSTGSRWARRRAPPALVAGGTLELGAGAGGASGFLAGDLDEVALYDRAVTRSHIAAHVAPHARSPARSSTAPQGASYTPTLADLGDTLQVMTIVKPHDAPGGEHRLGQREHRRDRRRRPVREAVDPHARSPGRPSPGPSQFTATVAGLPFDRAEFLVDGVVRYAKDEPPLGYTWYTNAEPNGTHTLAIRAYGPRSSTPVTTTMNVTRLQQDGLPHAAPVRPREPLRRVQRGRRGDGEQPARQRLAGARVRAAQARLAADLDRGPLQRRLLALLPLRPAARGEPAVPVARDRRPPLPRQARRDPALVHRI